MVYLCSQTAFSAPPFYTDDAEPAAYRQLQTYYYATLENPTHNTFIQAPAVEIDYGIIPNTEIHFIFTLVTFLPQGGQNTTGIGDIEAGIKTVILTETERRPKIALAPALEIPAGNYRRNLGNGRLWSKWPIWFEKNFGPWNTSIGGGYVFNSAPNMKTYLFGGWTVQRDMSDKLMLGAEIFSEGSYTTIHTYPFQDTGASTILNLGLSYNFTKQTSFIFSGGHTLVGVKEWVAYGGLYVAFNL